MPQPSVEIVPYLATPLPPLREAYPPGTGGTGPREEFKGTLQDVGVLKGLSGDVEKCESWCWSNVRGRLSVDKAGGRVFD
jgi:hypothetical protein